MFGRNIAPYNSIISDPGVKMEGRQAIGLFQNEDIFINLKRVTLYCYDYF